MTDKKAAKPKAPSLSDSERIDRLETAFGAMSGLSLNDFNTPEQAAALAEYEAAVEAEAAEAGEE